MSQKNQHFSSRGDQKKQKEKNRDSSWKPRRESLRVCSPFSFLDVQLKAHLSFSFLAYFRLGLAAGNLRLMFGQFTIQERNYITAPPPLPTPPAPAGEWEITLSVQFLSVFGAVK